MKYLRATAKASPLCTMRTESAVSPTWVSLTNTSPSLYTSAQFLRACTPDPLNHPAAHLHIHCLCKRPGNLASTRETKHWDALHVLHKCLRDTGKEEVVQHH
eukprot:1050456-Amphidinium_carterae.1